MNLTLKPLATLLTASLALTACATAPHTSTNLKATATQAQDAIFKHYDATAVNQHFKQDYIQHNPNVPTGLAPIIGFLPKLEKMGTRSTTHRLLQDGNFTVMHNTYDNAQAFGAEKVVTFDVWRFEDGKVAEHWDAITPVVTQTASGRSQVDGPTQVTDLDKTQSNKAIVRAFARDVLMGKNPHKVTDYISTQTYHQHNPMVKDGLDGFADAVKYLKSKNDMFKFTKVHKILGEGNFVLTISEGQWHGKTHAFTTCSA